MKNYFLLILVLGILSYTLNMEILWWNEEIIIAFSLLSFFMILNYIIKTFVILMIFQRNVYIYISFKSLILLNIVLVRAIISISNIMSIISSNRLDYLNSFVRTECENIIITYNNLINMISYLVENYLYLIR